MDDFLEENVEARYFISDAFLKYAEERSIRMVAIGNGFKFEPRERETDNRPYDNHQSGSKNYRQLHRGIYLINPEKDGTCRTIKAQYAQTSFANFLRTGSFGATGVIKIE